MRIGNQPRVHHDSVDEVIYHGGDAVDATKSVVEGRLFGTILRIEMIMTNYRKHGCSFVLATLSPRNVVEAETTAL